MILLVLFFYQAVALVSCFSVALYSFPASLLSRIQNEGFLENGKLILEQMNNEIGERVAGMESHCGKKSAFFKLSKFCSRAYAKSQISSTPHPESSLIIILLLCYRVLALESQMSLVCLGWGRVHLSPSVRRCIVAVPTVRM